MAVEEEPCRWATAADSELILQGGSEESKLVDLPKCEQVTRGAALMEMLRVPRTSDQEQLERPAQPQCRQASQLELQAPGRMLLQMLRNHPAADNQSAPADVPAAITRSYQLQQTQQTLQRMQQQSSQHFYETQQARVSKQTPMTHWQQQNAWVDGWQAQNACSPYPQANSSNGWSFDGHTNENIENVEKSARSRQESCPDAAYADCGWGQTGQEFYSTGPRHQAQQTGHYADASAPQFAWKRRNDVGGDGWDTSSGSGETYCTESDRDFAELSRLIDESVHLRGGAGPNRAGHERHAQGAARPRDLSKKQGQGKWRMPSQVQASSQSQTQAAALETCGSGSFDQRIAQVGDTRTHPSAQGRYVYPR